MFKNWIVFVFIFSLTFRTIAQDTLRYEIATDRPSLSFSVATTPRNVLIVETGYLQFNQNNDSSKITTYDPNIYLRYGLSKRLELRLGEEFLLNRIQLKNFPDSLIKSSDFLPVFLGAKYRLNNPENEKWALSALWASRVPIPARLETAPLRHYGRILGQYNFGKNYFFSNLGLDFTKNAQNTDTFLAYTLGIGRNFIDGLHAFIETFGLDSLKGKFWSKGLDTGIIYIVQKRYQVDAVFGFDLATPIGEYNFFTIGFSTYFL